MDTAERARPSQDGPVVVGVDGSVDSRDAARLGAREARTRGVALELLLAFPWGPHDTVPAPDGFDGREVLRVAAGLALDGIAAAARHQQPGLQVCTRLVPGRPVQVLVAASASAQLVCVGSRSTGTIADLALGSTAAAVVQASACPVLVVPVGSACPPDGASGVVVGLDGGEHDDDVAAFALHAAAVRGCALTAAHGWRHTVPGYAGLLDPFLDTVTAQRREDDALTDVLLRVHARHPEVPVHRLVGHQPAARLLLDAAAGAELVVVGHRHRTFARLGSVAGAVLHRAHCPVAVVPLTGRPRRTASAEAATTSPGTGGR